jgi:Amt family ammonium transporter
MKASAAVAALGTFPITAGTALASEPTVDSGDTAWMIVSTALTALGAALLWFGWFGFNAGSQLAADGLVGSAFLVTNTSAAVAGLSWMGAEWIATRKPTVLGLASGIVAGLVSITPAAGFVNLGGAMIIGLVAGVFGFYSVSVLKHKLGYDDSLDAFGVHGMCGLWGALATGLLADPAVTVAYTAVVTLVVVAVTRAVTGGLRVDAESEVAGLDNALHGERAFEIQ